MSWLSKLVHSAEDALKPEMPTLVKELDSLVEKWAAEKLSPEESALLHSVMQLLISHLSK